MRDRQIKFRYVWQHDTTKQISISEYTLHEIRNGEVVKPDFTIRWDLIAELQLTGLKDKNRKEAYEKDYDEDGNMIDFCERCSGYQFFQIDIPTKDIIHCQNCEGNFMLQDHIPDFVIISNLYK